MHAFTYIIHSYLSNAFPHENDYIHTFGWLIRIKVKSISKVHTVENKTVDNS